MLTGFGIRPDRAWIAPLITLYRFSVEKTADIRKNFNRNTLFCVILTT